MEIKDKLVTAESLKILHNYNAENFETKENVENLLNEIESNFHESLENTESSLNGNLADFEGSVNETFEDINNSLNIFNDSLNNKFDKPANNIIPINKGGTGASNANDAIRNLGITPTSIGAEPAFDVLPITQGGTNASNGATGLKNLFASGATILSSYQYGDTLPSAGTAGRIFFKKLSE